MRQPFRKMKKIRSENGKRKYKESKKVVQKTERQSYWNYINNIIETDELGNEHPPKQKKFWTYIKSLLKDSTGITTLKDNGRLFNASKDKADILNRQFFSRIFHLYIEPIVRQREPGGKKVREKSREYHNHKPQPFPRGTGNRQLQTSTNRTNVQKALRLSLSSPSEVIAMLKQLKNTSRK